MEQIKKMYKVADQTRTIHSLLRSKLVLFENIIQAYVTIGSAISAMLIFAPIDSHYDVFVGMFIASIFVVSLVPNAFAIKQKILSRSVAVQAWGKWVHDAKSFCQQNSNSNIKESDLIADYKRVMDDTPLIPDNVFNKYKQKHLQKVAISKSLDEFPFKTIKEIKKEFERKVSS